MEGVYAYPTSKVQRSYEACIKAGIVCYIHANLGLSQEICYCKVKIGMGSESVYLYHSEVNIHLYT